MTPITQFCCIISRLSVVWKNTIHTSSNENAIISIQTVSSVDYSTYNFNWLRNKYCFDNDQFNKLLTLNSNEYEVDKLQIHSWILVYFSLCSFTFHVNNFTWNVQFLRNIHSAGEQKISSTEPQANGTSNLKTGEDLYNQKIGNILRYSKRNCHRIDKRP